MVQIKKKIFFHLLEHLTELQRCVFCCVYEDRQGMQHISYLWKCGFCYPGLTLTSSVKAFRIASHTPRFLAYPDPLFPQ